jgi:dTDP-glucose 4,6-dehydratase
MKFLITGGRGFIGSHFVDLVLKDGHQVIDIDNMTYAANKILPWDNNPNYNLLQKSIVDLEHLPPCDVVVNFAAESHVDNSITSSKIFFETNTRGVYNLLELLRGKIYNRPLFFHISTDEVYGDIREANFTEEDKLNPGNPYSSSKAAAEMFVLSYNKTYGIDYVITRSSNNYGERQYVEKLIPQIIYSLENNKKIPIHGDGSYVRDWIYVKDNVEAIYNLVMSGVKNEIFNISANNHMTNLEVVKQICDWYNVENYIEKVSFVPNRIGQDIRYSIDCSKIKKTGWSPKFINGIHKFQ